VTSAGCPCVLRRRPLVGTRYIVPRSAGPRIAAAAETVEIVYVLRILSPTLALPWHTIEGTLNGFMVGMLRHIGILLLLLVIAGGVSVATPMSIDPKLIYAVAIGAFLLWLAVSLIFIGGKDEK
jgi:hypothetical protein